MYERVFVRRIDLRWSRVCADRAENEKNDSRMHTSRNEASDQSRGEALVESSSSTTMNRRRGLLARARAARIPIKRPCERRAIST